MLARADLNILVVDDMAAMRLVLKGTLGELGFTSVVEATNGQMAVDLIRRAPGLFRLVLSDWMMPQMSGLELVRTLRSDADPRLKRLPVVLITAENSKDSVLNAGMAGASGYIIKPFSVGAVEKAILRIFPNLAPAAT